MSNIGWTLDRVVAANVSTEPAEVTCGQCGLVRVDVPVIVDFEPMEERLEIEEAIRNGTIQLVTCPGCGALLEVDAPLLVHLPGQEPPLVFSWAEETTKEQDGTMAWALVERWQGRRGRSNSDESTVFLPIPGEHYR